MDRETTSHIAASEHAARACLSLGTGWRVVDLCCGLGGISHAARDLGCEIALGVDLSPAALETFRHNFPAAAAVYGSVTRKTTLAVCRAVLDQTVTAKRTLLVSGPPCQGFSVAGPRAKRDPRNRVLMAVARAIVALGPDAALVENVAALMRPQHRQHLGRFRRILTDVGYHVVILRLDAADFGVAQVRHRMICFASKQLFPKDELQRMLTMLHRPQRTVREALSGLRRPATYRGPGVKLNESVANHVAMRHSPRVKAKIAKLHPGSGPLSYRRLHPDRPARTLISGNRAPPAHHSQARSITPREAARLQGFPDSFVIKGTFSVQMLHVTNAVPPPLAGAALAAFFSLLDRSV